MDCSGRTACFILPACPEIRGHARASASRRTSDTSSSTHGMPIWKAEALHDTARLTRRGLALLLAYHFPAWLPRLERLEMA
jgi:hypothetical protein